MTTTATEISIPEYPKIETLFNRDPANKKHVIPWDYRLQEFEIVKRWLITEKIDGTNVRVIYQDGSVRFGGRTDNAQMPIPLLDALRAIFTTERLASALDQPVVDPWEAPTGEVVKPTVVLFGEGYGGKIQSGGNYRSDPHFRLFDVAVWGDDGQGGKQWWWLQWKDIVDVADKMGISVVPVYGIGDLDDAFHALARKSEVALAEGGNTWRHEGIVCRAEPPLFTRRGRRLIWKLKLRDLPIDLNDYSVESIWTALYGQKEGGV